MPCIILTLFLDTSAPAHYDSYMNKRRNRLGFTLAELLIVAAIITVLAGISIPIFTAQKKKAQIAAVRYNIRAAKAAASAAYMTEGFKNADDAHGYYVYNTKTGTAYLYSSGSSWVVFENINTFKGINLPGKYDYTYIFVYVKQTDSKNENDAPNLQSCPYYDETKNEIVYDTSKPYGTGN